MIFTDLKYIGEFDSKLSSCIFCNSSKIRFWKSKFKDNYQFDIYLCSNCSSGFMNPRPKIEWLKSIYTKSGHGLIKPITLEEVLYNESEYPNSSSDAERFIKTVHKFMHNNKKPKTLDIGSGYGFYSYAAIKHGYEVTAVNPSIWENNVFEEMNKFRPIESNFEESHYYGQSEKFDLIIISQILEHVYDPNTFLLNISKLLKKDGIAVIAIPNFHSIRVKLLGIRDNSCLWVPEHLNHFSVKGIFSLLERKNLTVLKHCNISRIPYFSVSNLLNLKGRLRNMINSATKYSQKLPLSLCDIMGLGFYLNLWAQKP